jgi:hypothetical protein
MRALPLLALLAAGVSASAQGLIQESVLRSLDKADALFAQGDFAQGGAHLEAVLVTSPLLVSADTSALPDSARPACLSALRRAADLWEDSAPGVRIQIVESGADVQVEFVEKILRFGGAAGFAEWRRGVYPAGGQGWQPSLSANIWVAFSPREDAMTQAAAHEIGHLLGLKDGPAGGVMGPVFAHRPALELSSAEANAIQGLRFDALVRGLHAGWQPSTLGDA